ncbi:amino acid decarboxylase [Glycomyces fuscus]|nr:amino acid decarboxylase [Glycomyces fuscus]
MSNRGEPVDVGDWPARKFREHGEFLLEELERWFVDLRSQAVRPPPREARDVLEDFGSLAPKDPEPFDHVVTDTIDRVFKGSVLWNHPRHHAYFSNSSSAPAILAEACTAALNTNVMVWDAAPAAAAVEQQVLRWLASLAAIDWPDPDSVLVDGASQATLYALAAAREHLCEHDFRTLGANAGPVLRVYCSEQTHSSVDKAAITLGIGLANVVRVSDQDGLLDPVALEEQIRSDRAQGMMPLAVVATVGTTSTAGLEPLGRIAEVSARLGTWLHVDAAFGGLWRASSELAAVIPSPEGADSVVINPHKVLFCPMEASALYCRHPGALVKTFSLVPEYLRTDTGDDRLDYMNYSTQLGRQFRALKVWWIIRCFGTRGISARLDHTIKITRRLERCVEADPVWEVVAPTPLPLICIRPSGIGGSDEESDRVCKAVHDRINRNGHSAVSHARVNGRYVIRISVGNIHTEWRDLEYLWQQITTSTTAALRR